MGRKAKGVLMQKQLGFRSCVRKGNKGPRTKAWRLVGVGLKKLSYHEEGKLLGQRRTTASNKRSRSITGG